MVMVVMVVEVVVVVMVTVLVVAAVVWLMDEQFRNEFAFHLDVDTLLGYLKIVRLSIAY